MPGNGRILRKKKEKAQIASKGVLVERWTVELQIRAQKEMRNVFLEIANKMHGIRQPSGMATCAHVVELALR